MLLDNLQVCRFSGHVESNLNPAGPTVQHVVELARCLRQGRRYEQLGFDASSKVIQATLEGVSSGAIILADLYTNNADMLTAFCVKRAGSSANWSYFGSQRKPRSPTTNES